MKENGDPDRLLIDRVSTVAAKHSHEQRIRYTFEWNRREIRLRDTHATKGSNHQMRRYLLSQTLSTRTQFSIILVETRDGGGGLAEG